jgi:hypothetical protein
MVAPVRPKAPPSPALRRAHELVAATLLEPKESSNVTVSPRRKWKAWICTAWVAMLATLFLVYLLYAL